MSVENIPSMRVAEKNGMKLIRQFTKEVMGRIVTESLYCIEMKNGIKACRNG
jgi:RimJ/RimL family protein N-acetyltransferase